MPARREDAPAAEVDTASSADASLAPDTADTTPDAAASDSVTAQDSAEAQDSAGPDDVPVPEGCKADSDCKKLLSDTCHQARCQLATGLCVIETVPDGISCGGPNKCLTAQQCKAGQCVGKAVDCDDGDICTTDTCNKLSGCITTFNTLPCNDGDPCTYQDTCDQGKCQSKPLQCIPSKDPCAQAVCVKEKGGCVLQPKKLKKGETCSDGDPCTTQDACISGVCVGTPMTCQQDGDPCTAAKCSVVNGKAICQNKGTPLAACDDKNPCTLQDRCDPTKADPNKYECVGTAKVCDDETPCTNDSCAAGSCVFQPVNAACSDNDPCTQGDACKDGKCTAKSSTNCDDGNLCTTDSCDPKSGGCVHKTNGGACSDGDVCTSKDACVGVSCVGTKTVCDDQNPCTTDACISGVGCVASAVKNGTTCTKGGQCWGGACVVPKCSNTICEFNEDTSSCAVDCPAGGGLCAPDKLSCVTSCQADRCGTEAKTCATNKACPVLLKCLDDCTNDGCRLGCVKTATPTAVTAYYGLTYCLSTKCLKNSWNGKQCKTSASGYAACIAACQSGVCTGEEIACRGSGGADGCATIETCVNACPVDDNTCPIKCIKAGTAAASKLYDTLTLCVQAKCL